MPPPSTGALEDLLAGPTDAEREDGYVEVSLVLLRLGGGADPKPTQRETLLDDLAAEPTEDGLISASPFWLTLDHGVVTRIEEQYLP